MDIIQCQRSANSVASMDGNKFIHQKLNDRQKDKTSQPERSPGFFTQAFASQPSLFQQDAFAQHAKVTTPVKFGFRPLKLRYRMFGQHALITDEQNQDSTGMSSSTCEKFSNKRTNFHVIVDKVPCKICKSLHDPVVPCKCSQNSVDGDLENILNDTDITDLDSLDSAECITVTDSEDDETSGQGAEPEHYHCKVSPRKPANIAPTSAEYKQGSTLGTFPGKSYCHINSSRGENGIDKGYFKMSRNTGSLAGMNICKQTLQTQRSGVQMSLVNPTIGMTRQSKTESSQDSFKDKLECSLQPYETDHTYSVCNTFQYKTGEKQRNCFLPDSAQYKHPNRKGTLPSVKENLHQFQRKEPFLFGLTEAVNLVPVPSAQAPMFNQVQHESPRRQNDVFEAYGRGSLKTPSSHCSHLSSNAFKGSSGRYERSRSKKQEIQHLVQPSSGGQTFLEGRDTTNTNVVNKGERVNDREASEGSSRISKGHELVVFPTQHNENVSTGRLNQSIKLSLERSYQAVKHAVAPKVCFEDNKQIDALQFSNRLPLAPAALIVTNPCFRNTLHRKPNTDTWPAANSADCCDKSLCSEGKTRRSEGRHRATTGQQHIYTSPLTFSKHKFDMGKVTDCGNEEVYGVTSLLLDESSSNSSWASMPISSEGVSVHQLCEEERPLSSETRGTQHTGTQGTATNLVKEYVDHQGAQVNADSALKMLTPTVDEMCSLITSSHFVITSVTSQCNNLQTQVQNVDSCSEQARLMGSSDGKNTQLWESVAYPSSIQLRQQNSLNESRQTMESVALSTGEQVEHFPSSYSEERQNLKPIPHPNTEQVTKQAIIITEKQQIVEPLGHMRTGMVTQDANCTEKTFNPVVHSIHEQATLHAGKFSDGEKPLETVAHSNEQIRGDSYGCTILSQTIEHVAQSSSQQKRPTDSFTCRRQPQTFVLTNIEKVTQGFNVCTEERQNVKPVYNFCTEQVTQDANGCTEENQNEKLFDDSNIEQVTEDDNSCIENVQIWKPVAHSCTEQVTQDVNDCAGKMQDVKPFSQSCPEQLTQGINDCTEKQQIVEPSPNFNTEWITQYANGCTEKRQNVKSVPYTQNEQVSQNGNGCTEEKQNEKSVAESLTEHVTKDANYYTENMQMGIPVAHSNKGPVKQDTDKKQILVSVPDRCIESATCDNSDSIERRKNVLFTSNCTEKGQILTPGAHSRKEHWMSQDSIEKEQDGSSEEIPNNGYSSSEHLMQMSGGCSIREEGVLDSHQSGDCFAKESISLEVKLVENDDQLPVTDKGDIAFIDDPSKQDGEEECDEQDGLTVRITLTPPKPAVSEQKMKVNYPGTNLVRTKSSLPEWSTSELEKNLVVVVEDVPSTRTLCKVEDVSFVMMDKGTDEINEINFQEIVKEGLNRRNTEWKTKLSLKEASGDCLSTDNSRAKANQNRRVACDDYCGYFIDLIDEGSDSEFDTTQISRTCTVRETNSITDTSQAIEKQQLQSSPKCVSVSAVQPCAPNIESKKKQDIDKVKRKLTFENLREVLSFEEKDSRLKCLNKRSRTAMDCKSLKVLMREAHEVTGPECRKFSCSYCARTFRRESLLDLHKKHCLKEYRKKHSLKRHLVSTAIPKEGKEITCANCARTFKRKSGLLFHQKVCKENILTENGRNTLVSLKESRAELVSSVEVVKEPEPAPSGITCYKNHPENEGLETTPQHLENGKEVISSAIGVCKDTQQVSSETGTYKNHSENVDIEATLQFVESGNQVISSAEGVCKETEQVFWEMGTNKNSSENEGKGSTPQVVYTCKTCGSPFDRKAKLLSHRSTCNAKKGSKKNLCTGVKRKCLNNDRAVTNPVSKKSQEEVIREKSISTLNNKNAADVPVQGYKGKKRGRKRKKVRSDTNISQPKPLYCKTVLCEENVKLQSNTSLSETPNCCSERQLERSPEDGKSSEQKIIAETSTLSEPCKGLSNPLEEKHGKKTKADCKSSETKTVGRSPKLSGRCQKEKKCPNWKHESNVEDLNGSEAEKKNKKSNLSGACKKKIKCLEGKQEETNLEDSCGSETRKMDKKTKPSGQRKIGKKCLNVKNETNVEDCNDCKTKRNEKKTKLPTPSKKRKKCLNGKYKETNEEDSNSSDTKKIGKKTKLSTPCKKRKKCLNWNNKEANIEDKNGSERRKNGKKTKLSGPCKLQCKDQEKCLDVRHTEINLERCNSSETKPYKHLQTLPEICNSYQDLSNNATISVTTPLNTKDTKGAGEHSKNLIASKSTVEHTLMEIANHTSFDSSLCPLKIDLAEPQGQPYGFKVALIQGAAAHQRLKDRWSKICPYGCDVSFSSTALLNWHVQKVHPWICRKCKTAFLSKKERDDHRYTHIAEQHHCQLCQKAFMSARVYYRHLRSKKHCTLAHAQLDAINFIYGRKDCQLARAEDLSSVDMTAALLAPPQLTIEDKNGSSVKHFYYPNQQFSLLHSLTSTSGRRCEPVYTSRSTLLTDNRSCTVAQIPTNQMKRMLPACTNPCEQNQFEQFFDTGKTRYRLKPIDPCTTKPNSSSATGTLDNKLIKNEVGLTDTCDSKELNDFFQSGLIALQTPMEDYGKPDESHQEAEEDPLTYTVHKNMETSENTTAITDSFGLMDMYPNTTSEPLGHILAADAVLQGYPPQREAYNPNLSAVEIFGNVQSSSEHTFGVQLVPITSVSSSCASAESAGSVQGGCQKTVKPVAQLLSVPADCDELLKQFEEDAQGFTV